MKGIIYKITNKVNGKSYIGQTRYTIEFRWRQHQHKKDNTYFHNAIHKYGIQNFNVEVLEECDVEKLNSREIFYIAKYNTFKEGYNLTIGGEGNKRLVLDDKYDEIKELYLSGFSSNKIATLYKVDKATIVKILRALDVKIRDKSIKINHQEFLELIQDYKTGYSLRELAKRYDCDSRSLKEYLLRKGVDIKNKYTILKDEESQEKMIKDYLDGDTPLKELLNKYHCSYNTFTKILSLHGIDKKGKGNHFKLNPSKCLEAIRMFNTGSSVKDISKRFEVNKCTIYSLFKRYHVNYLTV